MSDHVVALYIGFDDQAIRKMEQKWQEWNPGIRLVVIKSRYRSIMGPLKKFIDTVEWKTADTDHITILIPQFITRHWWQNMLHNQTSFMIRAYLINYKDVIVTTVPYHLNR